jgi:hypothetical protein
MIHRPFGFWRTPQFLFRQSDKKDSSQMVCAKTRLNWLDCVSQLRVPGLEDESRSGRRVINDESVERRIPDQLAKAPPAGFARWNGRLVAESLGDVSDDAVWRVMRKHDLHLDRRQSWCVSTDPEFSRKAT